jgi:hypothetical protein
MIARLVAAFFFSLLLAPPVESTDFAQAVTRQDTVMYAGPGPIFPQIGAIQPETPVRLIERNQTGLWVLVQNESLSGWVLSGHLEFALSFRLDGVPLNTQVKDGDPSAAQTMHEALLNLYPVVPATISDNMRAVYARGQRLGNQPFVATKVGDSVLANEWYLQPMSAEEIHLGPYAYLEEALSMFGPAMADSVVVRKGLTSAVVFDPFWADKERCQPGETPLDCEYRLRQPSVAFIMFSHNDMKAMSVDDYRINMRRIVEESMTKGIIPVLMTFSSHPNTPMWAESLEYNSVLLDLATQYQVPLINLWLASRILPDYGLEIDHVHLKNSGYDYLTYENGQEAQSGVALLNLLSLQVLDEIRLAIITP